MRVELCTQVHAEGKDTCLGFSNYSIICYYTYARSGNMRQGIVYVDRTSWDAATRLAYGIVIYFQGEVS